jgi:hypothetical protein
MNCDHDLLTRLYLRQYAFLRRRSPRQPPSATFHYATIGVSALMSLASLALLALGFWAISWVLNRLIVPWDAPEWLIVLASLCIAFLPGVFIDKKMSSFRDVDQHFIVFYSTPKQRFLWWLAVFSIFPLAGIVAACFASLRSLG